MGKFKSRPFVSLLAFWISSAQQQHNPILVLLYNFQLIKKDSSQAVNIAKLWFHLGLYRTSHPVRKSSKCSRFGLSGNRTFSFPDAKLLEMEKIQKKIQKNFFFLIFSNIFFSYIFLFIYMVKCLKI